VVNRAFAINYDEIHLIQIGPNLIQTEFPRKSILQFNPYTRKLFPKSLGH
tara:strand:- start:4195 stop:4344 length:150 start_codon:yes stop_codon:yes gene_type:complete